MPVQCTASLPMSGALPILMLNGIYRYMSTIVVAPFDAKDIRENRKMRGADFPLSNSEKC